MFEVPGNSGLFTVFLGLLCPCGDFLGHLFMPIPLSVAGVSCRWLLWGQAALHAGSARPAALLRSSQWWRDLGTQRPHRAGPTEAAGGSGGSLQLHGPLVRAHTSANQTVTSGRRTRFPAKMLLALWPFSCVASISQARSAAVTPTGVPSTSSGNTGSHRWRCGCPSHGSRSQGSQER